MAMKVDRKTQVNLHLFPPHLGVACVFVECIVGGDADSSGPAEQGGSSHHPAYHSYASSNTTGAAHRENDTEQYIKITCMN